MHPSPRNPWPRLNLQRWLARASYAFCTTWKAGRRTEHQLLTPGSVHAKLSAQPPLTWALIFQCTMQKFKTYENPFSGKRKEGNKTKKKRENATFVCTSSQGQCTHSPPTKTVEWMWWNGISQCKAREPSDIWMNVPGQPFYSRRV